MLHSKDYQSAYEEIISHYPMFYREVLEMRAILEAEGRILDETIDNINTLLNNAFIDTADLNTIDRLERFLRIKPDEASSIDDRRTNVKAYVTGFGKISASTLKSIIFPFTETEAVLTFLPADEQDNDLLSIVIPRGEKEQVAYFDMLSILARRIPAHLWYRVDVIQPENANFYFGIVTITLNEISLRSEEETIV